jgi:autotransporter-associated beta strand protein
MGGAIFVMQGASLTIAGKSLFAGDGVQGGNAGNDGTNGQAFGGGMFLEGSGTIRFRPGIGQTEHVFNPIDDEAGVVASAPGGYTLIKSGLGTLVLSVDNGYSGGTILKAGTLDVAAPFASGIGSVTGFGSITFAGSATLKIDNAALSELFGHIFYGAPINSFGGHDILDLTGLHFHRGATATYNAGTDILFVNSGSLTYELALLSPHGTQFAVANDRHGGTRVTLDSPPVTATVVSLSTHDWGAHHPAADLASATHLGDFLFVG